MAGIPIRYTNELHGVPEIYKLGGGASKLNLAVIGVRSDAEDPQLTCWHPSHVGRIRLSCPVQNGCRAVQYSIERICSQSVSEGQREIPVLELNASSRGEKDSMGEGQTSGPANGIPPASIR